MSSTPLRSSVEPAVFSDGPACASSPPSSPPEFPWERQKVQDDENHIRMTNPSTPPKTAFSVLGKRKPLSTTSANLPPAKKARTVVSTATTNGKPLTQMQISAGQRIQKKCTDCGMEYVASSAEDRKLHDIHHRQHTEGYDVGREFIHKVRDASRVFPGPRTEDKICVVDCFDSPGRKRRAQAVLEIVQRELGAVPIDEKRIWSVPPATNVVREPGFTAYMYIRGSRCVGYLLLERITAARRVVEGAASKSKRRKRSETTSTGTGAPLTALAALKARRLAVEEALQQASSGPIQLSAETYPARLGISRIWTSRTHRGQNIARTLLDTALAHQQQYLTKSASQERASPPSSPSSTNVDMSAIQPKLVRKSDFAFSQPTEAGARLARRWFGQAYGWAVYVD